MSWKHWLTDARTGQIVAPIDIPSFSWQMTVSDFGFTTTEKNLGDADESNLTIPWSALNADTPAERSHLLSMGRRALCSAWVYEGVADRRGTPIMWGALGEREDTWLDTTFPVYSPMTLMDGRYAIRDGDFQDGVTYYTHVAYADDAAGSGFATARSGSLYIGVYVDALKASSAKASDYRWSHLKGVDSSDGEPNGTDSSGHQLYLHRAWADSADGKTNFSTTVSAGKKYVGSYTDATLADSSSASKYGWAAWSDGNAADGYPSKTKLNGQQPYLHTAYADSVTGAQGFSTIVSKGKAYYGTYTDYTQANSDSYKSYQWFKSEASAGLSGANGGPGPVGANTNSRSALTFSNLSQRGLASALVNVAVNMKNGGTLPFDLPYLGESGHSSGSYPAWNVQNLNVKTLLTDLANADGGPDITFRPYWSDDRHVRVNLLAGSDADIYLDMDHAPVVLNCFRGGGTLEDLTVDYKTPVQRIFATGAGTDASVVTAIAEDLSQLTGSMDPPMLQESVYSNSDTLTVSLLKQQAQAYLKANRLPLMQLTGSIDVDDTDSNGTLLHPLGSFWPGETFILNVTGFPTLPDGQYRTRLMGMSGDHSSKIKLQFDVMDALF
ncbi:MAG: hypothetical protein ABF515_01040 [Bifidobacterium sp.]|uniref:Minor tail protein n=1 Tax=Bifidobacterium fermentum TaxID=3059035 RepID=A0AB39UDG6_9BIFI